MSVLLMVRSLGLALVLCMGLAAGVACAHDAPLVFVGNVWEPWLLDTSAPGGAGECAEVLQAVAARAGVQVVVRNMPKPRYQSMLRQHEADGIVCASPAWDKELAGQLVYTPPFAYARDLVLLRSDLSQDVKAPCDLAGLQVGATTGYWYGDEMHQLFQSGLARREDAPVMLYNIRKLAAGRLDAVIAEQHEVQWASMRQGLPLRGFKRCYPFGAGEPVCIAIAHHRKELLPRFTKALEALQREGVLQSIAMRYRGE